MFCKASVNLSVAFVSCSQSYSSRRVITVLANSCLQVGRYKVRSLMQQASLKPVWKRKFVHTTDSKHALPVAPNVLAGQCRIWLRPRISLTSAPVQAGCTWLPCSTAQTRGLGDGAENASCLGPRCPAHGDPSAAASGQTGCPLRPRQPICERPVPGLVDRAWLRLQHEPKRQLLRHSLLNASS
jgi:hypothetical protein